MLRAAIDYYHALLTDETAGQTQAMINEQLFRQGLYFGNRPLTTVLRPRFFTRGQYRFICRTMRPILSAFRKAHDAALQNKKQHQIFPTRPKNHLQLYLFAKTCNLGTALLQLSITHPNYLSLNT